MYALQNEDGGWGLHIEGHSTMFGSVLSYVTLRLLGEEADGGDGAMEKGRKWILDHGSATATTSWGKFWLTVKKKLYQPFSLKLHVGFFIIILQNGSWLLGNSDDYRCLEFSIGLETIL